MVSLGRQSDDQYQDIESNLMINTRTQRKVMTQCHIGYHHLKIETKIRKLDFQLFGFVRPNDLLELLKEEDSFVG